MSRPKNTSARTRTPDPETRTAEIAADAPGPTDPGTRTAETPADARTHTDPEARFAEIPADHTALVEGVPVTSPARTIVDLAALARPRALEQVLAEAERRELANLEGVSAALERVPWTTGATVLRQLIVGEGRPALTRSEAEERLLALVTKGGLQPPETNVRMGGNEVDFLWRSERVVVEVDGFAHHSSRRIFENDRRRDARLAALGFRVVRVTWRQLTKEPHAVLVRLAQVLVLARTGR